MGRFSTKLRSAHASLSSLRSLEEDRARYAYAMDIILNDTTYETQQIPLYIPDEALD